MIVSICNLFFLIQKGFEEEEAYEMVEEQDRQTREYRQIERLLAVEQVRVEKYANNNNSNQHPLHCVQLEELGAKEIDTADTFLNHTLFEHKPPE